MSKKVYNVSIYIDLHGVNCPGVWLCQKGKVLVKISLFGVSDITKRVSPIFPLSFNERFHFKKTFRAVNTMCDLHNRLHSSLIKLQLIQCPPATTEVVLLAVYCSPLSEILYPYPNLKVSQSTADVDLLFCPCKIFPGIIAPKAVVTTKINVVESIESSKSKKMNPAISSKNCKSRLGKDDRIIRQKRVCHSKYNLNCKCYLKKSPKCYDYERKRTMADYTYPIHRKYKSVLSTKVIDYKNRRKYDDGYEEDDEADGPNTYVCYNNNNNFGWRNINNKKSTIGNITQAGYKTKIRYNDDDNNERNKKIGNMNQHEQAAGEDKGLLCPCCAKEPKVRFKNFSSPSLSTKGSIGKKSQKSIQVGLVSPQTSLTEGGKTDEQCTVCNCHVCMKYENYFIHRAVAHNRGDVPNKKSPGVSVKLGTDSYDSNLNFSSEDISAPIKCYCFKDKKDIRRETDFKNNIEFELDENNVDKCYVCKCPLPKKKLTKSFTNQKNEFTQSSDKDNAKCSVCKCPIIRKNDDVDLRERFYDHLQGYHKKLIKATENTSQLRINSNCPRLSNQRLKKPSSRLLIRETQSKWSSKIKSGKGTGDWQHRMINQ